MQKKKSFVDLLQRFDSGGGSGEETFGVILLLQLVGKEAHVRFCCCCCCDTLSLLKLKSKMELLLSRR